MEICAKTDDNLVNLKRRIFKCIEQNDLTNLRYLLSLNAQALECLDDFSNTPFLLACYFGRNRIVHYLLSNGADHQRINIFGNKKHFILFQ